MVPDRLAPVQGNLLAMPTPTESMELRRLPGLFRRWELAELLAPGEDFHLEDAGTTSDGTPLLAVYRRVRSGEAVR